jgi:neurotransmitter:Na+ symporter, NSS family
MEQSREQWGSKAGFILAAVGSAVGLGNIWRYPYVLYSNGGGAFLIPYFFALFTAGIPLMILEYGLGHKYRGSTPLAMARANKKSEWLGWWPSINSLIILTYYTVILSWAVNYLYLSAGQAWGEDTNSFFFGNFLKISDGPFSLGGIVWPVFFGVTAMWALNWFICYKGVKKGIEKVSKILLPLLLVLMIIIVIRGLTLPGASVGLNKLFTPDWSMVMQPKVWIAAYGQVFFSLSLAMGVMMTYSSYLPRKTDINNSAFMTAFANSGFEFLAAIGVFAILGFMATNQGVEVSEVAKGGIGLAFVVFPEIFNAMGGFGRVFGVVFFSCLVFAGLTSSVSLVEAFSSAVIDKTGINRKKIVTITCVGAYAVSVLYATGAGLYFLDIIDNFVNSYGIVVVGLAQAVVVGWIVGAYKLREYTNSISYYSIGRWWDVMIKYVTPLMLTYMLIQSVIAEIKVPYDGYPRNATLVFGWGVIIAAVVISLVISKRSWSKESLEITVDNAREV